MTTMPVTVSLTIATSIVHSKLDYCNSLQNTSTIRTSKSRLWFQRQGLRTV